YSRNTGTVTFTVTLWDPDSFDRFTTLQLYGDTDGVGGSQASILTTLTFSFNTGERTVTRPLSSGTSYYFVKAKQTDGNFAWSSPIWITAGIIVDTTAPSFYGLDSCSDATTGGRINLWWSPATDPSTPVTYTIYRSTTETFDFATLRCSFYPGTTYQDSGLNNGTTYYYIVRARDNAGNIDSNTTIRSAIPTGIPAPGNGTNIVINEFKAKFSEWIEVYNPTATYTSLTGWRLTSVAGALDTTLTALGGIPSYGYKFITMASRLDNGGDIISLYDASTILIDRVGYGTRGAAPVDGLTGISIARLPSGSDTDDDGKDWNITSNITQGAENIGLPSNLGDSPIKINEVAPNPVNKIELYNASEGDINITGWIINDGDDPYQMVTAIVPAYGFYVYSFTSTAGNGGINPNNDNIYLWNKDTVRFDQVGFSGAPAISTSSTFQRYPNGTGSNESYNWAGATAYSTWIGATTPRWVTDTATFAGINVPVELSYFGSEINEPIIGIEDNPPIITPRNNRENTK
ncbi:MAG: lamin tail domain-containing protein, partial [bacterium]|nr:lamin tail domain-containing protein [bacterium]